MSYKQKRQMTMFLFLVTCYFYTLQESNADSWKKRTPPDAQWANWPSGRTFSNPALTSSSWTPGNVSRHHASWGSGYEHGYQSDPAGDPSGFPGVEGKIFGPQFYHPHFSEWLDMRPLVLCDHNGMTFTASGGDFTHLLVHREGALPVSLFHLPPYCGYSVKMLWSDLEMMVPYDACYITHENGSFVLPLLWWDSPLYLSCPEQVAPPVPSVFCSPYGMAVELYGQVQDLLPLGVRVNGDSRPFVNEQCASFASTHPEQFTFLIPFSASCVTLNDGHHIWLIVDVWEYTLTCPINRQLPSPSSLPPSVPPYFPPTTLPPYLPYFQHGAHFPQFYPPGPQPQQPLHPSDPGEKLHPVVPYFSPLKHQHHSLFSYYYAPPLRSTSKQPTTGAPPSTQSPNAQLHPHYFHHYPYSPFFTVPRVTQTPSPPPPPSSPPPKLPAGPQHPFEPYYPPSVYGFDYPYWHVYHKHPRYEVKPPATEKPQTTQDPRHSFCPYGHTCSYYNFYNYNPYYHPHHPAVPQHPVTTQQPTTMVTNVTSSPPKTSQPISSFECVNDKVIANLPSAHVESIQVKDHMNKWVFIHGVPHCGYRLETPDEKTVTFHSPLPTCHSRIPNPTTVSLSLRFWDKDASQFRVMNVQCPLTAPHTPAPGVPPTTTKRHPSGSVSSNTEVFCSPHRMVVKLPPGPISAVIIKDIKGNKVKLQDAPKSCRYSASKGNDGKIRLSLPLHSGCHVIKQDTVYLTIEYMTSDGISEAQVSCPVTVPGTGQECNFPSEQRLPCGHSSVSQPQCLSMGCCFSKHPPACYYPMDECTIDRHFVFSVPASLTEPPLSPALLVVASNSTCKPEKVTSGHALFKIPMDGCGSHRMQVGNTVIYMVELINIIQAISVGYGTITRDSPVRLFVECRFLPGAALTVSYMVKTPTLGPAISTQGAFGVQLRIAEDAQYSRYYPQYHKPLDKLLGKPLYLEVRLLNTPDPSLVLLVHYCVAYPRSGKAVWVLLYNGCPNPFDPTSQHAIRYEPPPPQAQTRRFTINTFRFLPDGEFKGENEEIYFMCSTEICSPRDGPCVEGCFGQ